MMGKMAVSRPIKAVPKLEPVKTKGQQAQGKAQTKERKEQGKKPERQPRQQFSYIAHGILLGSIDRIDGRLMFRWGCDVIPVAQVDQYLAPILLVDPARFDQPMIWLVYPKHDRKHGLTLALKGFSDSLMEFSNLELAPGQFRIHGSFNRGGDAIFVGRNLRERVWGQQFHFVQVSGLPEMPEGKDRYFFKVKAELRNGSLVYVEDDKKQQTPTT